MKFYHYAFNQEILSKGLSASIKHQDTETINNLIAAQHDGECFGRDYCVFLNFDNRDIGDFSVSVDSDSLDKDLIFIANQEIANNIYSKWYRGQDTVELTKKYVESIKTFSEYCNDYLNPEIMYLDDISSELISLEIKE